MEQETNHDYCKHCKVVELLNENLAAKKKIIELLKGNIQPVKIKKKHIKLSPN